MLPATVAAGFRSWMSETLNYIGILTDPGSPEPAGNPQYGAGLQPAVTLERMRRCADGWGGHPHINCVADPLPAHYVQTIAGGLSQH